jgi:hypothetical protein
MPGVPLVVLYVVLMVYILSIVFIPYIGPDTKTGISDEKSLFNAFSIFLRLIIWGRMRTCNGLKFKPIFYSCCSFGMSFSRVPILKKKRVLSGERLLAVELWYAIGKVVCFRWSNTPGGIPTEQELMSSGFC